MESRTDRRQGLDDAFEAGPELTLATASGGPSGAGGGGQDYLSTTPERLYAVVSVRIDHISHVRDLLESTCMKVLIFCCVIWSSYIISSYRDGDPPEEKKTRVPFPQSTPHLLIGLE